MNGDGWKGMEGDSVNNINRIKRTINVREFYFRKSSTFFCYCCYKYMKARFGYVILLGEVFPIIKNNKNNKYYHSDICNRIWHSKQ